MGGVVTERHPEVPAVVFITGSGKALKGGDRWGRFGAERWNTGDGRAPELFIAGELPAETGGVSAGRRVLHEAAHGVAHPVISNDEYRWIRSWWNASLAVERDRYGSRAGQSVRRVLRALGAMAQRRGSRHLEVGTWRPRAAARWTGPSSPC